MRNEKLYRFLYPFGRFLAAILFPYRVRGAENIPGGAAILCPNHSSLADPILVSLAMGRQHFVRHLAKAETRRIPILGKIMEKAGSIFVRRGESDIESFKACIRALKAGEKLMIFPEGTRVHGEDEVGAKSGVIRMAARQHVPIVPVYLPRDKKLFRRFPIVFGEPYYIENAGRDDYDRLAGELMDRIWALKE